MLRFRRTDIVWQGRLVLARRVVRLGVRRKTVPSRGAPFVRFDLDTLRAGVRGVWRGRFTGIAIGGGAVDGDEAIDDANGATFAEFFAKFFNTLRVHPGYLRFDSTDNERDVTYARGECMFR